MHALWARWAWRSHFAGLLVRWASVCITEEGKWRHQQRPGRQRPFGANNSPRYGPIYASASTGANLCHLTLNLAGWADWMRGSRRLHSKSDTMQWPESREATASLQWGSPSIADVGRSSSPAWPRPAVGTLSPASTAITRAVSQWSCCRKTPSPYRRPRWLSSRPTDSTSIGISRTRSPSDRRAPARTKSLGLARPRLAKTRTSNTSCGALAVGAFLLSVRPRWTFSG